jgi:hypothetical protein
MMRIMSDKLKSGETRIIAEGEYQGVTWKHIERQVPGTIGITQSYELMYRGQSSKRPTGGNTPEEAAVDFKQYVDEAPARREAADRAQQEAVSETARRELERGHAMKDRNPLGFSGTVQAWMDGHGGQRPLPRDYWRWAHEGVSQAEHDSDWYQAALARKQAQS